MMGVRLEISGLRRSFLKGGQEIRVLEGCDLSLAPGEAAALIGQSGSGKSTFLQLVGGLEAPTGGTVRVDGVDIHRLAPRDLDRYRNAKIGFIFQFHHLLPDHSALDNVAMPGFIARMPRAEARARAEAVLRQVGLGHRLDHRPGELSGGEQQRVAIARALLLKPGLILADEPTGNLDPRTAEEVFGMLQSLTREERPTLVLVTHSLELAARLPRRLVLRHGALEEVL